MTLRGAGLKVELHSDHFRDDSPDEAWISEVGRQGWIVLTKDKAIRRRDVELQAVIEAKVRMFSLTSGNMTGDEMAAVFVENLPKIGRFIKNHPAPFIARVSNNGVARSYPSGSDS